MTDKQLFKLALEALEACNIYGGLECVMTPDSAIYLHPAITALKARLAQPEPEQEPCGWQFYHDGKWHNGMETNDHRANTEAAGIPIRDLYTHSPQRTEQEPDDIASIIACRNMLDAQPVPPKVNT